MTHVEEPPGWSWALMRRSASAAIVCLAVGAALGYGVSHRTAPSRRGAETPAALDLPMPAGDAELSLLVPLRVGTALADYTVERIDAVRDGTITIVCARGVTSVKLYVALSSPEAPPAPATSGRYSIYYSAPRDAPEVGRLCDALARVLGSNTTATTPGGLGPFRSRSGGG